MNQTCQTCGRLDTGGYCKNRSAGYCLNYDHWTPKQNPMDNTIVAELRRQVEKLEAENLQLQDTSTPILELDEMAEGYGWVQTARILYGKLAKAENENAILKEVGFSVFDCWVKISAGFNCTEEMHEKIAELHDLVLSKKEAE